MPYIQRIIPTKKYIDQIDKTLDQVVKDTADQIDKLEKKKLNNETTITYGQLYSVLKEDILHTSMILNKHIETKILNFIEKLDEHQYKELKGKEDTIHELLKK